MYWQEEDRKMSFYEQFLSILKIREKELADRIDRWNPKYRSSMEKTLIVNRRLQQKIMSSGLVDPVAHLEQ